MKFLPLIAILLTFGLTGCESISEVSAGMRDKMAARSAPQIRTFPASPHATYDAVRAAATEMGYRFIRGGPAQGELEAISRVGSGETLGSARQLAMKVALEPTLDGKGTEVAIRLTEIIEADSSNRAGQATETPLRDTPQYDVFFRRVGRELGVDPDTVR